MFFKMSQEFINNLKSLLANTFSENDFDISINAFENLINIEDNLSNFDAEYGKFLSETNLLSPDWDVFSGCRVEGFLRKIENLKGNSTEGMMLQGLYKNIGFYNWLNESDIQTARANDTVNSANAMNRRDGEGFHLAEADATKYKGCQHHFDSYITTYQLRNRTKAHDGPVDRDFSLRFDGIKSLFIVYLDQCFINSEIINNGYERELISNIDYVKFVNESIEESKTFNGTFLQLEWIDEQNGDFSYDYSVSVKLIGEAGMGKTTQMRKMYFNLIDRVKEGEMKVLPAWIDLSCISDKEDSSLKGIIKDILGEYEQYYEILLKNKIIMLFLDGYNEILAKDGQENIKRKFAADIDEIHKKYPEVFIAITDRNIKSNPPCLNKNIRIYSFKGLSERETLDYLKLKTDDEAFAKIIKYMKSDKSNWLKKEKMIPAKLNSLIDLITNDIIPENEDEFYDKYLDLILEREEEEKKETRIDDLRYLLYILAQELNHWTDEKNQNEIIQLWLKEGQVGDLREAWRLFKLATEIPILIPGEIDKSYRFAYLQYYQKMVEGM